MLCGMRGEDLKKVEFAFTWNTNDKGDVVSVTAGDEAEWSL